MDRIVCAAIKVPTDKEYVIICGARHFDSIMHKQLSFLKESVEISTAEPIRQGFINQRGEFLTREDAYIVAYAAGQITNPMACTVYSNAAKLFSEGLY